MREDMSAPEDSEEEDEEEEEETSVFKWQGIESIFEAYQEYVEGKQLIKIAWLRSNCTFFHH